MTVAVATDDEGPDATPGFDGARAFEVGVDLGNGVGVDAEVDGQLPDRWQLVAWLQGAGGDGDANAALELRVEGRRVGWIDLEVRRQLAITERLY